MDKQTTLAFILIGGILVLWLYLNTPDPVPQQPAEKDTVTVQQDTIQQRTKEPQTEPEQVSETADTKMFRQTANEEIIVIENDLVLLEISTKGANLHKYFLKNFNNWYSVDAEEDEPIYKSKVQLINYSRGNALNINFVSSDGKIYNTEDFIFEHNKDNLRRRFPHHRIHIVCR
jgi:YidC/Oxa1 family membrane protein insertase